MNLILEKYEININKVDTQKLYIEQEYKFKNSKIIKENLKKEDELFLEDLGVNPLKPMEFYMYMEDKDTKYFRGSYKLVGSLIQGPKAYRLINENKEEQDPEEYIFTGHIIKRNNYFQYYIDEVDNKMISLEFNMLISK